MMVVDVTYSLGTKNRKQEFHFLCDIPVGQFVTIFGKSGVGKTTFLRILAGLEKPSSGSIHFQSDLWFHAEKGIDLKAHKRNIKMVFQQNTLFPNMTVRQNLEFAKSDRTDFNYKNEIVSGLDIEAFMDFYPHQLSGGQAQRVAIGQMLIGKPNCVLLDEPLTSLDQSIRIQIQEFLKATQRKYKMTVILVSHDVEETIKLSDQVLILENGAFKAQGSPFEIFGNVGGSKSSVVGKVVRVTENSSKFITVFLLVGHQIIEQEHPISDLDQYKLGSSITLPLA